MAAPEVTVVGSLSPSVDGGYILLELSQSVVLSDVTTPAITYKTLPVPTKALINTDGQLFPDGTTPGTVFKMFPTKGTLVFPSYGVYYKSRIVTSRGNLTTKSRELWEVDSSFTSINVASIPVIAELPVNFYLHKQLAGLDQDDHPQYVLRSGDIESTRTEGRVILRSADNQRWQILVDTIGVITVNTI